MSDTLEAILAAAAGKGVTFLVDGNIPVEQLCLAGAWCEAWPEAKLCIVVEPAERDMLLGMEASDAEYLPGDRLSNCDGFVIIGNAFAANPMCSRGVFDRLKAEPRTPAVVIDPAAATCWKFASHKVDTPVGGELASLLAVTSAAGAPVEGLDAQGAENTSAVQAGKAISGCKRLGVLVAAEYGRSSAWRQIGYAAGMLAKAKGGAVSPQTTGANALAAVRLADKLGAVSLASALADGTSLRVSVGCDLAAMVGAPVAVFCAAAALPNRTTESAEIVLPLAMSGEMSGVFLSDCREPVKVASLMPPPAGALMPADVIAALARKSGISEPATPALDPLLAASVEAPRQAPARGGPQSLSLLLGRQAIHAGCGELTAHGSWASAVQALPELRVNPDEAARMGLRNLGVATVRADGKSVQARVKFAAELPPQVAVLPEGLPQTRALVPGTVDNENDTVTAVAAAVEITAGN